ncbi:hypothetical protein HCR16_01460 [Wolbachia pipientis]|uniref:hypothetical protein n=1 Tax=Wolbachia pipientis TaxID=955 RepID=UPI0015FDBD92|nr:hypothetical protein [Wolbachia pipientis]MBA8769835.1 hypothetical protein [Wolbachia pipientis]
MSSRRVSSQCLTLGSRKIDCALCNIFDQKLDSSVKYWNLPRELPANCNVHTVMS